jgi:hypothetical protein
MAKQGERVGVRCRPKPRVARATRPVPPTQLWARDIARASPRMSSIDLDHPSTGRRAPDEWRVVVILVLRHLVVAAHEKVTDARRRRAIRSMARLPPSILMRYRQELWIDTDPGGALRPPQLFSSRPSASRALSPHRMPNSSASASTSANRPMRPMASSRVSAAAISSNRCLNRSCFLRGTRLQLTRGDSFGASDGLWSDYSSSARSTCFPIHPR